MSYQPMTVVSPDVEVTTDEMAARVRKTREEHGPLLADYHRVWYEAGHTWCYTHFLGVGLMKGPNDLWMYQTLMTEHRPKTVIETGTYHGGSALWFAYLMDMLRIDGGKVFTVDIADYRQCAHPRVTFLDGHSADPVLVEALKAEIAYPLLVVLDSDHSEAHVRAELDLYGPLCRPGDWLVVEDTNVAWVGEGGDRGAMGGLDSYLADHPGEWRQDVLCERYLLTMNPGGWLQRVR